jgi:hypothetical protein
LAHGGGFEGREAGRQGGLRETGLGELVLRIPFFSLAPFPIVPSLSFPPFRSLPFVPSLSSRSLDKGFRRDSFFPRLFFLLSSLPQKALGKSFLRLSGPRFSL